VCLAHSEN